MMNQPMLMIEQ